MNVLITGGAEYIGSHKKKVTGLLGTGDLTDWEEEVVQSIKGKTQDGNVTVGVTDKQWNVVERIHNKHFG